MTTGIWVTGFSVLVKLFGLQFSSPPLYCDKVLTFPQSIFLFSIMSSSNLKDAVMRQIHDEHNKVNVATLMEVCQDGCRSFFCPFLLWRAMLFYAVLTWGQKMNEACFEKCVPNPGTSLSSGESACLKNCMDKYMAAWNQVNVAFVTRVKKEQGQL